ncbi:hypothetical protein [Chamaesiphon sp. OTE_20_metabat_361]|uniref:hypothetical protein n=1 Tax=Chamaesiphon sp. OTE_20_metabat_361 TaxID=2964689 RepID=UPI00286A3073|nr:hypothetical protein [Chamaesiphon sp. OTE_20_metabat_361]
MGNWLFFPTSGEPAQCSWGATFVGEASPTELRLFPRLGSFHGRRIGFPEPWEQRRDELRQVKHIFKTVDSLST